MDDKAGKKDQARRLEKGEGIYVDDLAAGAVVEIETQHHHYTLVKRDGPQVLISGHPQFCPKPVAVQIEGSFAGPHVQNPKVGFIGRGMYLLFKHPLYRSVVTSRIREIHRLG